MLVDCDHIFNFFLDIMHPKKNHSSEYVKTSTLLPKDRDNPIATHLNASGLDLDDLAASVGLDSRKVSGYFHGRDLPTEGHLYLFDLAFGLPQGTLKEEYGH
jgi:hypothetical protein